jgi:hypothetical protein
MNNTKNIMYANQIKFVTIITAKDMSRNNIIQKEHMNSKLFVCLHAHLMKQFIEIIRKAYALCQSYMKHSFIFECNLINSSHTTNKTPRLETSRSFYDYLEFYNVFGKKPTLPSV